MRKRRNHKFLISLNFKHGVDPEMSRFDDHILIIGEAPAGARIRPHNWAERYAGNLASWGRDLRLRYARELEPVMVNGTKCLRVARSLEHRHPSLFRDILQFAALHRLPVEGLDPAMPMAS